MAVYFSKISQTIAGPGGVAIFPHPPSQNSHTTQPPPMVPASEFQSLPEMEFPHSPRRLPFVSVADIRKGETRVDAQPEPLRRGPGESWMDVFVRIGERTARTEGPAAAIHAVGAAVHERYFKIRRQRETDTSPTSPAPRGQTSSQQSDGQQPLRQMVEHLRELLESGEVDAWTQVDVARVMGLTGMILLRDAERNPLDPTIVFLLEAALLRYGEHGLEMGFRDDLARAFGAYANWDSTTKENVKRANSYENACADFVARINRNVNDSSEDVRFDPLVARLEEWAQLGLYHVARWGYDRLAEQASALGNSAQAKEFRQLSKRYQKYAEVLEISDVSDLELESPQRFYGMCWPCSWAFAPLAKGELPAQVFGLPYATALTYFIRGMSWYFSAEIQKLKDTKYPLDWAYYAFDPRVRTMIDNGLPVIASLAYRVMAHHREVAGESRKAQSLNRKADRYRDIYLQNGSPKVFAALEKALEKSFKEQEAAAQSDT